MRAPSLLSALLVSLVTAASASASTATITAGVLVITGDPTADVVGVQLQGAAVTVQGVGGASGGCSYDSSARTASCPAGSVSSVAASLGGGGDSLYIAPSVTKPVNADLGDGSDSVQDLGTANDQLAGGTNSSPEMTDLLVYLGSQPYTANLLTGSQSAAGIGADVVSGFTGVIGGNGNDTLTADNSGDLLIGYNGVDTITGGTGNDTIGSEAGVASGGAGSDDTLVVPLGLAAKTVDIPAGTVGAQSFNGFENYVGDEDPDTFKPATTGAQTLRGSFCDDPNLALFYMSLYSVACGGEPATDTVDFSAFSSPITADLGGTGSGAGATFTFTGLEAVIGGSAGDILTGTAAAERLSGGPGNDTIRPGLGNDTVDGGTGTSDSVTYEERIVPVTINLAGGQAGIAGETDTLTEIENATGGAGGNTITGNAVANVLTGGAGADTIDITAAGTDHAVCLGGTDAVSAKTGDVVDPDCETVQRTESPSPQPTATVTPTVSPTPTATPRTTKLTCKAAPRKKRRRKPRPKKATVTCIVTDAPGAKLTVRLTQEGATVATKATTVSKGRAKAKLSSRPGRYSAQALAAGNVLASTKLRVR